MTATPARSIAPAAYDAVSRSLHWGMATLIVIAFVLGLTVDLFPKSWDHALVEIHKIIGTAILLLLLVRLGWRLTHRAPAPEEGSAILSFAARAGHIALYIVMFIVPILGILYAVRRGQGLDFGLFALPPLQAAEPRSITRPIRTWHELAAYALIAFACLHAIAACWHHFIRQDGVLRRMLPASHRKAL
ncbi:cytochrome b [Bosea sp. ANAM02]|uniref:cytochrome b n=1 Tax=Bosea sp. ANAM02 TaxID=2020412 RepID=UPI00140F49E1|nr:cytochrome b [Bosea sp. ANAM02]BCB20379.1 cytochrome b [Bosea sp. ANAM02]